MPLFRWVVRPCRSRPFLAKRVGVLLAQDFGGRLMQEVQAAVADRRAKTAAFASQLAFDNFMCIL